MTKIPIVLVLVFVIGMVGIGTAEENRVVNIDIKPGSLPNSINLGNNGNIPVAILGSSSLDATKIEPTTLTLAKAPVMKLPIAAELRGIS